MIRTWRGTVLLTAKEFEALPDYSCSLPSRTTIGKRWRKRRPYEIAFPSERYLYYMGEYVKSDQPGMVGIEWTEIELPPGYIPEELRRTMHDLETIGVPEPEDRHSQTLPVELL